MTKLHFGASIPQIGATWSDSVTAAQHLEMLGFDSLWVSDHMVLPYGGAADTPIFEAFALLSAIAVATERVELGTDVANIMFRNPAVMAKQFATIDHISGGRMVPGVGAGYVTAEFIAYGCPPWRQRERTRALAESCHVMRALWTGAATTFEGEFVHVRDAVCQPTPTRHLPLLVGGASRTTLRAAAAHADIWNNPPQYEDRLSVNRDRLWAHANELGRDPDEITISQRARVVLADSVEAASDHLDRLRQVIGPSAVQSIRSEGIWGDANRVGECIQRYADLGCTHFIIDFYSRDHRGAAEVFANEVMPAVR